MLRITANKSTARLHMRASMQHVLRFVDAVHTGANTRNTDETLTVIGILQSKGKSTLPTCCQVELCLGRHCFRCVCSC